jgi:hypothetical protein
LKDGREVQLVFPSAPEYLGYKSLLGKRVVANGTLFGGHTGRHHTLVFLTAKTLRLPRWK